MVLLLLFSQRRMLWCRGCVGRTLLYPSVSGQEEEEEEVRLSSTPITHPQRHLAMVGPSFFLLYQSTLFLLRWFASGINRLPVHSGKEIIIITIIIIIIIIIIFIKTSHFWCRLHRKSISIFDGLFWYVIQNIQKRRFIAFASSQQPLVRFLTSTSLFWRLPLKFRFTLWCDCPQFTKSN